MLKSRRDEYAGETEMYQLLVWHSEHTACACFMLYALPAPICVAVLCALRPHKHLTHFGLHLLVPVGQGRNAWKHIAAMTGGGFLGVAQMGFHMGASSRRLCGVDSQTLPCQGAVLCPGAYLPPCCCFVSPGLKLKRLLLLITMQWDFGGRGRGVLGGRRGGRRPYSTQ